jgi:site-specific DNA-adenine methylase
MSGNKNKKIAFNYFGGKFTFLDELYDYFPAHFTHLGDVFGGSFCVTLNYNGKVIKTVNEINSDITNFFQVLRDHETELTQKSRQIGQLKALLKTVYETVDKKYMSPHLRENIKEHLKKNNETNTYYPH